MRVGSTWFLVPVAAIVVAFVWASLRSLRADGGELADRVAEVGFYACLFVGAVLLFGLMIARME